MTSPQELDINFCNGGEWIAPVQCGVFDTLDPSDESVLARVASATAEDIDLAVAAARRAFDEGDWPRWPNTRRSTRSPSPAAHTQAT